MTLSDLQSHAPTASVFKVDFLPYHTGIVPKQLNAGSCKQRLTIA